jgi:hypothetical protein
MDTAVEASKESSSSSASLNPTIDTGAEETMEEEEAVDTAAAGEAAVSSGA